MRASSSRPTITTLAPSAASVAAAARPMPRVPPKMMKPCPRTPRSMSARRLADGAHRVLGRAAAPTGSRACRSDGGRSCRQNAIARGALNRAVDAGDELAQLGAATRRRRRGAARCRRPPGRTARSRGRRPARRPRRDAGAARSRPPPRTPSRRRCSRPWSRARACGSCRRRSSVARSPGTASRSPATIGNVCSVRSASPR